MALEKKKRMAKKNLSDEDDDDDTFYYRYASAAPSAAAGKPTGGGGGSGTLAPSKSTLYVSNIDFSLTNSDLHTLFSTSGKVARVTVLKDRLTRLSRGVAFVQFVSRSDAASAAAKFDGKVLNGRTLRASIAADNGRAAEFIRKRVYRDKSRCYECGADGHLSYDCPRNRLGPRDHPEPKKERRSFSSSSSSRRQEGDNVDGDDYDDGVQGGDDGDNWASVVDADASERLLKGGGGGSEKKKAKKASYFSDESGDEDD